MADWKMYGERVNDYRRAYPVPHFGNRNDTIPIQSLAALAGGLVTAAAGRGEPVEGPVVLGFVGANLEAYDRCVRDGKQQLQLNFAEARALQATLDTLPERLRQQAVQACQAGVTRLASMRTTLDGFTQQAASAERALSDISFVTLSRRSRDVNAVACMP
jgi:hypothetical protein